MKKSILNSVFLTLFGVLILGAQDHVSVYSGCDFKGDRQRMYEGEYDDKDLTIGNDRISSIRVPEGWSVTVYKSHDFDGSHETYTSDVRCLPEKFNDAISSIRVYKAKSSSAVTIYSGCNLEGDKQVLREGDYRDRDIKIGNDRISSIHVPNGWSITVYKSNNFEGSSETYTRDVRCLPDKFNDAISSLRVHRSGSNHSIQTRNSQGNNNRATHSNSVTYNARGQVPCKLGRGNPTNNCDFGVVRRSSGDADVHITKKDGRKRVIYFQNGRAVGYDQSQADRGQFRASKESDLYIINIGEERYEIPEAVIYGG
jgi:hypothetical protein